MYFSFFFLADQFGKSCGPWMVRGPDFGKHCPNLTPNLTAIHVHHFLYYKLCQAVDIFQNLCRPNAIRAVNIFLSKSETTRNTRTADDFSWFLIFEQLTRKNIITRAVSSNNKIVSTRFFEQSNFEQMIMTQMIFKKRSKPELIGLC